MHDVLFVFVLHCVYVKEEEFKEMPQKKKNLKEKVQEAREEAQNKQRDRKCVCCMYEYGCVCLHRSDRQTDQREKEERGYCWKA